MSANLKPKRKAAASRGSLATDGFLATIIINWIQLDSAVLNAYLWTETERNLPPLDAFSGLFYIRPKCVCGWGSAPDSTGRAYSATSYPLWWGGGPLPPPPKPHPLRASRSGPSGRAFPLFPFYETTSGTSLNLKIRVE